MGVAGSGIFTEVGLVPIEKDKNINEARSEIKKIAFMKLSLSYSEFCQGSLFPEAGRLYRLGRKYYIPRFDGVKAFGSINLSEVISAISPCGLTIKIRALSACSIILCRHCPQGRKFYILFPDS